MKKSFLIILAFTFTLNAKTINYCEAPSKPAAFSTKAEALLYDESANRYEKCIKKFIKITTEEIEEKNKKLNQAIKDWNNFIKIQ